MPSSKGFPAIRCCAASPPASPVSRIKSTFAPALVEIEEALVPALIIEELENGSYTVLVPSVPTPMAGSLYILPRERVHRVDVPLTSALKVFTKWGTGAGELVHAMQPGTTSAVTKQHA